MNMNRRKKYRTYLDGKGDVKTTGGYVPDTERHPTAFPGEKKEIPPLQTPAVQTNRREPLNKNPTEFLDAPKMLQMSLAAAQARNDKIRDEAAARDAERKAKRETVRNDFETAFGWQERNENIEGAVSGVASGALPNSQSLPDAGDPKKDSSNLLKKLLGGPDPYGAKPSGLGKMPVPDAEDNTPEAENESDEQNGAEVPDVEVNGYIEALRGILDPDYAARASEDVMGQYAAMTGGRPSSAAISAGTAARADAEATLLRELLSGGDTQSGESGGLLSGLLGENATTGEMDVPEEYAGYADLPGYDTIVPMLESFESEEDMGDYLADMVNKGFISEAVATEYLKRFDDPYEEYDAGGRIDYASMVKNPGGWTLTDDGGTNFFGGLNRNMRIKSPNGQEFTVAQLYRLLKKNGMDDQEAKYHLVKLQNYLKSKK